MVMHSPRARNFATLIAAGLLSGCGFECAVCTTTPAGLASDPAFCGIPENFHDDATCGAVAFQDRLGARLIGPAEALPENGPAVRAADFPTPRRIAPASAPVRLGDHPERINIFLNNRGEVVRITCG
ncbi:hypothetical protein IHV25_08100 [Phaeovibrio sulfidiphilus]|uniref:Proteinase inhibitor I78 n=1 Tax=Phaeovibrio sulfidiphilus TaxID=1220600 RepID=A0A8J7CPY2_9PROT|nr:hypothetical protein [Phaeovibrio sulfidiphilus]MBE1237607.1 hypothetical protein [Phaeovibrio sulfidiphilus]